MFFNKIIEGKVQYRTIARAVVTAVLFFGCSTETVLAVPITGTGSFTGTNVNGSPRCSSNSYLNIHFYPLSDGLSCSFATYAFEPVADGSMTITITPTGNLSWGRYGWPSGTEGMFAFLSLNNDPSRLTNLGAYFDASTVTVSIPVVANQTYYLHVGYGDWLTISGATSGSFKVDYRLPDPPGHPAVDEDVPLPAWAIFMLGAGLLGIGYRRKSSLR